MTRSAMLLACGVLLCVSGMASSDEPCLPPANDCAVETRMYPPFSRMVNHNRPLLSRLCGWLFYRPLPAPRIAKFRLFRPVPVRRPPPYLFVSWLYPQCADECSVPCLDQSPHVQAEIPATEH